MSQGFHCSCIFPTETCAYVYQRYTYKNILRSVIPDSPKPEIAQMLTNNRMEKLIVLYSYNVKLCSNENEWTYAIFRKWITHILWCERNQTLKFIYRVILDTSSKQLRSRKINHRLDVRSRHLWRVGEGLLAGLLGCRSCSSFWLWVWYAYMDTQKYTCDLCFFSVCK